MITRFAYPATLTPDGGKIVVAFPDLPEALSVGNDEADAQAQAVDCLEEAFAGRMRRRDDIPEPSPRRGRQLLVVLPALTAAKAALYLAMRDRQVTQRQLARWLNVDARQVRYLLDPARATSLRQIESGLAALGRGIEVRPFNEGTQGRIAATAPLANG